MCKHIVVFFSSSLFSARLSQFSQNYLLCIANTLASSVEKLQKLARFAIPASPLLRAISEGTISRIGSERTLQVVFRSALHYLGPPVAAPATGAQTAGTQVTSVMLSADDIEEAAALIASALLQPQQALAPHRLVAVLGVHGCGPLHLALALRSGALLLSRSLLNDSLAASDMIMPGRGTLCEAAMVQGMEQQVDVAASRCGLALGAWPAASHQPAHLPPPPPTPPPPPCCDGALSPQWVPYPTRPTLPPGAAPGLTWQRQQRRRLHPPLEST